jgi:glycine oxidase ThiO
VSAPHPIRSRAAGSRRPTRDVASGIVVLGGGLVGLATAAAIVERGSPVTVITSDRPGAASPAAAGMLAPAVEDDGTAPDVRAFFLAARDRFVGYLDWLEAGTGVRVPLNRAGVLRLAPTEASAILMQSRLPADARWLDGDELHAEEPGLARMPGAVLHPEDGAVDNRLLHETLGVWCRSSAGVRWIEGTAISLRSSPTGHTVTLDGGAQIQARVVILALGAWVSTMAGLPRRLPVEPVKGQMIAVKVGTAPRHVIFGADCYLVPRSAATLLVGATMERVGFDIRVDPQAAEQLRRRAQALIPSLKSIPISDSWTGLRPVSPDLLPILDRDPACESLIYACGHSRNGVLLAPLTGDCIAALALGDRPSHDLSPFRVTRFGED